MEFAQTAAASLYQYWGVPLETYPTCIMEAVNLVEPQAALEAAWACTTADARTSCPEERPG